MFHIHKWKTISVQHGNYKDGCGRVTLFSQKCRCEDWRIIQAAGAWELRDGFPVAAGTLRVLPS